jgi:hypothetical protein
MPTTLFPSILPDRDADDIHTLESAFGDGCPFCDEYTGEHGRQHARNAHPDQYEELADRHEEA